MIELDEELAGLGYISRLKTEIQYMESRYHARIREKNFVLADIIKKIIELYKRDLEGCEHGIIAQDSGGQVPQALPGRDKTVFVLKR